MKRILIVSMFMLLAMTCIAKGKRESVPIQAPAPIRPTQPQEPGRLYQTDHRIEYYIKVINDQNAESQINAMKERGCKFMSALGIAQTHAKKNLNASQINALRNDALSRGIITADMGTPYPARLINMAFSLLGVQLSASDLGKTTVLDRIVVEYDSTLIYGITTNGNDHWCEGDALGVVIYNPYPNSEYREYKAYQLIQIKGIVRGLQHSIAP